MTARTTDVANRYRIEAMLGKGGMGAVYRAFDRVTGRLVALKRLMLARGHQVERRTAQFEREFHALSQLSHPSIVAAYDYGIDDDGPYYTMELLEGRDLHGLAPLPYHKACALLYGIASALSLLHSRRLIHRDVTPRNILILDDKRPKLIDFGALLPMGPSEDIVGTPSFVAPEFVFTQPLDGRCDLYSLGVVLYQALTGHLPYRAQALSELRAVWLQSPMPPSRYTADIPPELDHLTLSLIALDRTARPRDAAEVMERLAAIGEFRHAAPIAESRAYLVAPNLVGRTMALESARAVLRTAMRGRGGASLLVRGKTGVGRSRLLDACALEAKVMGAIVLRTRRTSRRDDFHVARSIVEQLLHAIPDLAARFAERNEPDCSILFEVQGPNTWRLIEDAKETHRQRTIGAFRRLLLLALEERAIVIVLDDLYDLDEPSVAVFAILLSDAPSQRLAIVASANSDKPTPAARAYRRFGERSRRFDLEPLDLDSVRELLASIFGSRPNLEVVTSRIYRLSQGNPRDAITLAEHLVDHGVIRYDAGRWAIPVELPPGALPASINDALKERIRSLSGVARSLATAQALSARQSMTLGEYQRLAPATDLRGIHAAIDELLASDVLSAQGQHYSLKHEGWASALTVDLTAEETQERHGAIARMYENGDADVLAAAYHLLLAGSHANALDLLEKFAANYAGQTADVFGQTNLGATELGKMFEMAVTACQQLRRSMRLHAVLRRFIMAMGVFVDAAWFNGSAPLVLARLKRDSGYYIWQSLDPNMPPTERIMLALQMAHAEYERTPRPERVDTPAGAVRGLVQYTVAAIAVGARTQDKELAHSLPELLVPFAPLSPIVEAILENCRATEDVTHGRNEECRERYLRVLEKLEDVEVSALEHADEIRVAVTYGIGAAEMRLGIPTATKWMDRLGDHPRLAGTAMVVRAIACLHHGNWNQARRYKQLAEQFDIEHDVKQMFGHMNLKMELDLYALGLDLGPVKQLSQHIDALAEIYPGWRAAAHQAHGEYHRLRGDLKTALEHFEQCIALSEPSSRSDSPAASWYSAAAGKIEILLDLGRYEEARACATDSLKWDGGNPRGSRYQGVIAGLALAEARLGNFEAARGRLFALIGERLSLGTSGVLLGLLYEASALVAIWARDIDEFRRYAGLTAQEYLRCEDSGFSGRYKRLLQIAFRAGIAEADGAASSPSNPQQPSLISQTIDSVTDASERASRGLSLLCERAQAGAGFLYLLRDNGLRLVAAISDNEPEQDLETYLSQVMDKEICATEVNTVVEGDDDVSTAEGVWISPLRRSYRIVTLRVQFGAESSPVGIAALQCDSDATTPLDLSRLAASLSDYFLRADAAFPN